VKGLTNSVHLSLTGKVSHVESARLKLNLLRSGIVELDFVQNARSNIKNQNANIKMTDKN
jgi:hypothetical protein